LDLKDYYKILELPPSATLQEVKSAYRRLAHKYHPDKSQNDLYALAQFNIIKEAYEVLTDPARKEEYLHNRWYMQSRGMKGESAPVTPVVIMRKALSLDKFLSQLDPDRMDAIAVKSQMKDVFSDENIDILNHFNETEINNSIVSLMSRNVAQLPYFLAQELASLNERIQSDKTSKISLERSLKLSASNERWGRMHPWLITLIAVLICVFIYAISR